MLPVWNAARFSRLLSFKITKKGVLTTLYTFEGAGATIAALVQATDWRVFSCRPLV
jgi:hypothetical protein